MEHFAGLDISMDETHICVLGREGDVVHEAKVASTSAAIADELAKIPACRCVVFETSRMAPMLYHGLHELAVPVVCIESRQASQALKSLATHKTDCNDARGLTHSGLNKKVWSWRSPGLMNSRPLDQSSYELPVGLNSTIERSWSFIPYGTHMVPGCRMTV